jgi:hypothetical protein
MRHNLALPDSRLDGVEGVVHPMVSGLITGVALDVDLAAIRNLDPRPLCIRRMRIRWLPTTAFAAAQAVAFHIHKVYGFTAIHTTGSPKSTQAHHHYQGGIAGTTVGERIALTSIAGVIADTGALTGATYTTPDADEPEHFAVGASGVLPSIDDDYEPGLPVVLEQDTGLLVESSIAMGAGGVGRLFFAIDGYRFG